MKKSWIAYSIYILLLFAAVFLSYSGIFDIGTTVMFLLICGFIILAFCLGGYSPMRNYRLETEYSLKEAVDSKNDPLLYFLAFILLTPLILAIYILMQI